MAIVCGTDSCQRDGLALEVAGLLAKHMKLPLHLVHGLHDPGADPASALESARALARRSTAGLDGDLHLHVTPSPLAESLVQIADRVEATVIVVSVPERPTRAWCARAVDEILVPALVPLLFVRESDVFEGWANGVRPLRVVLDADFTAASRRASRWVERLAKLGPCEMVAVHQYETLRAPMVRQAVGGGHALVAEATVRASVERELRTRIGHLEGDLQLRTRLVPRRARSDEQLAECAIDEGADLVVLGHDVARRGDEGLVPELYRLLHSTDCSLLCVPSYVVER
jgi:nucleotide-binding universal stress UspA family protein